MLLESGVWRSMEEGSPSCSLGGQKGCLDMQKKIKKQLAHSKVLLWAWPRAMCLLSVNAVRIASPLPNRS